MLPTSCPAWAPSDLGRTSAMPLHCEALPLQPLLFLWHPAPPAGVVLTLLPELPGLGKASASLFVSLSLPLRPFQASAGTLPWRLGLGKALASLESFALPGGRDGGFDPLEGFSLILFQTSAQLTSSVGACHPQRGWPSRPKSSHASRLRPSMGFPPIGPRTQYLSCSQ
eukprot:3729906-Rhodomonas_salina.2